MQEERFLTCRCQVTRPGSEPPEFMLLDGVQHLVTTRVCVWCGMVYIETHSLRPETTQHELQLATRAARAEAKRIRTLAYLRTRYRRLHPLQGATDAPEL